MSKDSVISIVTVVFNAASTLEATIRSVISQEKSLFEFWIIDGGSTDGSIDIIRKYEDQLAGWISEPDQGIYDAMNKGIDRATGQWLYFLGGDDTLRSGILEDIKVFLEPDCAMVFGDILFDNGYRMRSFLGPRTVLQNTVHHQSVFYNKIVFNNFRYDTSLRIVSEYDIHLRLYVNKATTRYIPVVIADCATGGASSELPLSLKETNRVRSMHIRNKCKHRILSTFLGIYYAQKRVRYIIYGHRV